MNQKSEIIGDIITSNYTVQKHNADFGSFYSFSLKPNAIEKLSVEQIILVFNHLNIPTKPYQSNDKKNVDSFNIFGNKNFNEFIKLIGQNIDLIKVEPVRASDVNLGAEIKNPPQKNIPYADNIIIRNLDYNIVEKILKSYEFEVIEMGKSSVLKFFHKSGNRISVEDIKSIFS